MNADEILEKANIDSIKDTIINICNDNDLNKFDLIKLIEEQLAQIIPFDHDPNKTIQQACGLEERTMAKLSIDEHCYSRATEYLESIYIKRELAILFLSILGENRKLVELLQTLGISDSSSECQAEDTSECWKCPKKDNCHKFDI